MPPDGGRPSTARAPARRLGGPPLPHIAPLQERPARYERMLAMQEAGKTLEDIGVVFGISRQRVEQVLDKPPRKPGPPFRPGKVDELRAKLALWERRRAVRVEKGKPTTVA